MTRRICFADRESYDRLREFLDADDLGVAVVAPDDHEFSAEALRSNVADADVLVTALSTVSAEVLDAGDRLAYVVKPGVGIDNVDVDAATERGIVVTRAPGVNDEGIAEHTIGLAIALNTRMVPADRRLREGDWEYRQTLAGSTTELLDETVGIVGLGAIGQRLAEIATAVGMEVLAHDPYVDEETARDCGAELVALDDLLERSRYVSINCLLTEETHHLISTPEFERMRDEAVLINTARGPIVDEDALVAALEAGEIAGAGLDVFEEEPPDPGNPLFDRDDVVVTPHIAGTTREGFDRLGRMAAEDVARFFRGDPFVESHVVDPAVLDGFDHPFADAREE